MPPHLPLPVLFTQAKVPVISTEAAHAFVSSVAEKSASQPQPPIPSFPCLYIPTIYFFAISAQKSHVKPQKNLTPSNERK
jgi:hypothetical protein